MKPWLFLVPIVTSVIACRSDDFPSELAVKPTRRFLASESQYFEMPERALRKLVSEERRNDRTNHFCIVGYSYPTGSPQVWVHWVEEQRLIMWPESVDPLAREVALLLSQRDLQLGSDTVESESDVQGSSYLVTRAWWQAVTKDCEKHGERYTLQAFAAAEE